MAQERTESLLMIFFQLNDKNKTQTILTDLNKK